jgi:ABC-type transporter Mla subunit MlaD
MITAIHFLEGLVGIFVVLVFVAWLTELGRRGKP